MSESGQVGHEAVHPFTIDVVDPNNESGDAPGDAPHQRHEITADRSVVISLLAQVVECLAQQRFDSMVQVMGDLLASEQLVLEPPALRVFRPVDGGQGGFDERVGRRGIGRLHEIGRAEDLADLAEVGQARRALDHVPTVRVACVAHSIPRPAGGICPATSCIRIPPVHRRRAPYRGDGGSAVEVACRDSLRLGVKVGQRRADAGPWLSGRFAARGSCWPSPRCWSAWSAWWCSQIRGALPPPRRRRQI